MFEKGLYDAVNALREVSIPIVPLVIVELRRMIVHDVCVEKVWEFVYGAL